jgi:hypothetical protein
LLPCSAPPLVSITLMPAVPFNVPRMIAAAIIDFALITI